MANAITRRIIINGSKDYVVLLNIVLDGATAETATIVNAVTGDIGTSDKVVKVVAHMPVPTTLLFDATTDVVFQAIPANTNVQLDYKDIGGITNNAGTGKTGDILMTTIGNGTAGVGGTILLYVQKKS